MSINKKQRDTIIKVAIQLFKENKLFFIGFGILVGSIGLLLGALTVLVSTIMINQFNFELVPAMLVGFFSIGVLSFLFSLTLVVISVKNK